MMVVQTTTVFMLRKTFKDYDEIFTTATTNTHIECSK